LMDRLNKPVTFTVPMLFVALSMLLIGFAPPYTIFMCMFLFYGISVSTMDMIGNALVSDVQQKKRNTALSLMHGIASIGAVAAPLIAGGITENGLPWQTVYTAVGCFILVGLAVYILVSVYARRSLRAIKVEHLDNKEKGTVRSFIMDKNVWIAVLCTLMFGGYQSGIIVWVSQYFKEVFGYGQLAAGLGLTAYWLGAGIVRLLFGMVQSLRKLETRSVNIYGSILAGAVLVIGMLTRIYAVMLICVFLSGALNAPLLPRTMGLVSGWYRKNSGLAASSVFGALYLAYSFFPLLMGTLAYALGMDILIIVPAACTVISGVIAVLLPRGNTSLALWQ
jgi:MFS family permease